MKYLQLFMFLIVIASCSSTKPIAETVPKKTPKTEKNKDSLKLKVKPIDASPEKAEIVTDSVLKEADQNNNFGQVVTKRFIETHQLWDELLKKHVAENGKVNYKGFKIDRLKLYNYFKVLDATIPNEASSESYKLAYWINAYNAFTIDLILRHYPIKSIKEIKKPWDQRFWKLGDKWYNLNEIEHEILRKMEEPRIHFAIVCASFSCPKLRNEAYTASNIEVQLIQATKDFLNDSERNSISENRLELSKIFQWFAKDFKQEGTLIDFLNQYSDIKISENAKKHFKDYNWDLNE